MSKYTKKQKAEIAASAQCLALSARHLAADMLRVVRAQGKSAAFAAYHQILSAKYGAPRVRVNEGLKREYFELGEGRVIMFASPCTVPTSQDAQLDSSHEVTTVEGRQLELNFD